MARSYSNAPIDATQSSLSGGDTTVTLATKVNTRFTEILGFVNTAIPNTNHVIPASPTANDVLVFTGTNVMAAQKLTGDNLADESVDFTKLDFAVATAITTTATLTANGLPIPMDTSGGAFTATLPATPSAGDRISLFDLTGDFETNNLTLARNGSNIEGVADDLTLDIQNFTGTFIYYDATIGWKRIG